MKVASKTSSLLTWKIRLLLYISSLSSLLFMQNYSSNVCSFIDGLQTSQLMVNLTIIMFIHILIRETLFYKFPTPKSGISIPRHLYKLSIISWMIAGVFALLLHDYRYPDFPVGSHIKLLSGYWVLGGGVLAQLEYMIFERAYQKLDTLIEPNLYTEKISKRLTESILIFTFSPILILLLIVARYSYDGVLDSHVTNEVFFISLFILVIVTIVALLFGKLLKSDTTKIIDSIKYIQDGNYNHGTHLKRSDELGEIAQAINIMRLAIKGNIYEIESLNDEITSTQKEVVYTMGTIAESRSKETGNHVKRVAAYSELLGLKYGLDKDEAKLLRLASPMHDIGKVAIPDNILNKPGRHTSEEFEIMKTHAQLGYEMLKHSDRQILKTAAIVAYQHHEKYDGSGYPNGLQGEDIHIYGRITALADVFDALGSDRVYKKAWEDEKIFELLNEQKGKHFDPKLVELFFANIEEIYTIREQYKEL